MIPTVRRGKFAAAVTLVEVVVAMAVLAIAALGALGHQYYAAVQARIARAQTTSTRIAQMLLEDWKSTGGSEDYDPTALGLGFFSDVIHIGQGIPLPDGVYSITVDDVPMVIVLDWEDVDYDSDAEVTLRQITVTAVWRRDTEKDVNWGTITAEEVANEHASSGYGDALRPLATLTTYVRLDASGG